MRNQNAMIASKCHLWNVYNNFMFVLFFTLLYLSAVNGKIIIKDAGVYTISRGDLGMIFLNRDPSLYHISVKKVKCCEYLQGHDKDCDFMDLLGGDMGTIGPRCHKNISVLYPNMYLHDRRGTCLLKIKYKNKKHHVFETKATIKFNTKVDPNRIPTVLKGYYTYNDVSRCRTVDMDTLENCEAVDCQVKYLGSRSYYNRKWNRCQKVPVCIADPEADLPDVAYSPISNTCKDLNQPVSKTDLVHLETQLSQGHLNVLFQPALSLNVRCHNGYYDNNTATCHCYDGWTSEEFDKDEYEPSLSIYHMCNLAMGSWYAIDKSRIRMTAFIIAILAVAVAMVVILLSFILHLVYIFIQSFDKEDCECEDWDTESRRTSQSRTDKSNKSLSRKTSQNTSNQGKTPSSESVQEKE